MRNQHATDKTDKIVFNNIGHLLNADMLKEQFFRLNGRKAVGIDRVTKAAYGKNLDENITDLIQRIRKGTYKPKPARITEIPKEDGSKRPLAISCIEDKLVQLVVKGAILSPVLANIYLHHVIDEWFSEINRTHIRGRADMVRYGETW